MLLLPIYQREQLVEVDALKGKITKMKAWKSKLGFFVGIDSGEKDYLLNKTTDLQVGDEVEYEVGKPTDDGKPTLKSIAPLPVEMVIDEDKPRSAPIAPYRAHDWKDEADTRRAKVRLECLKLAIEGGATLTAVEKAREYEKYVRE